MRLICIARACVPLLLLAAACGSAHSEPIAKLTAADAAGMDGAEARALLTKALEKYHQSSPLRFTPVGIETGGKSNRQQYRFADLADPEVWEQGWPNQSRLGVRFGPWGLYMGNPADKSAAVLEARQIARAFYVLKYSGSAEAWAPTVAEVRAGKRSVTDLPEDARRFKVQADAAMQEKKLADASMRYADALAIAPWWAAGHFNRGLILGELGYYPDACIELSRYLDLVPDAPDARQAKDKIYEWEAKK